jgi:hypothetical protein
MIKSNELRVGNLALYKPYGNRDGELVTIAGILGMQAYFSKYSNESGMFHNLRPIPLTEEWLHKFGVTWNNINGREYYFNTTGLYCLHLEPPTKGEDDGWTPMTPDGDGSIGKEIFFVHQLQNLFFALTGEELTIKEPA